MTASVAVLLPCYNEGPCIRKVVEDFSNHLPGATIYVYDNNSTDNTVEEARSAGAIVRREPIQGKGNVVRRMFSDVEADIYVLVDGDDTYEAADAPAMIKRLTDDYLDMVVANRQEGQDDNSYRKGHRLGNRIITGIVSNLFGSRFSDILSGYRVLSRRFVKSFPGITSGFEVETELTIHTLQLKMPATEMVSSYRPRPTGSHSKLNTFKDGFRILRIIIHLLKETRPLYFFSVISGVLALSSIILAIPIIITFMEIKDVPRLPTAVLCTGIMILAFLSLACGMILDSVSNGRWEAKRSVYLSLPGAPKIKER